MIKIRADQLIDGEDFEDLAGNKYIRTYQQWNILPDISKDSTGIVYCVNVYGKSDCFIPGATVLVEERENLFKVENIDYFSDKVEAHNE